MLQISEIPLRVAKAIPKIIDPLLGFQKEKLLPHDLLLGEAISEEETKVRNEMAEEAMREKFTLLFEQKSKQEELARIKIAKKETLEMNNTVVDFLCRFKELACEQAINEVGESVEDGARDFLYQQIIENPQNLFLQKEVTGSKPDRNLVFILQLPTIFIGQIKT